MSRLLLLSMAACLGTATLAAQGQAPAPATAPASAPAPAPQYSAELKVGDMAPAFSLQASDGKTHSLAEYKGKTVVIAWFPKAFTGGCTAECKSIKENSPTLKTYDITYFMASVDDVEQNTKFAQLHEADFPILADPTKATAMKYGVIRTDVPPEKQFAARWTFYIGPDGRIKDIDKAPNTATAGQVMVAKLDALGVKKRG